ncbi:MULTISPECIES: PstS family phosphate ABC transporter substrate-binding protein [Emticicia]|uniref:PstS family phosphate ABC transporter substrate-binding protein n=1 Tax=Emticicia TaxID=312278 RepID=UPI0007D8A218|nr:MULTISPECIES: substrate-binding domain-containing protein [Emticicia]
MKRIFVFIVVSLLLWQCNSQEKQDLPNEGEITIAADESVKPIVDAEVMAYNAHYPKAKINVVYVPEQRAMSLMMNDSVNIAIVTREATANEQEVYTSNKIPYLPAKMALDGVAIISNLNSSIKNLSASDLKEMFEGNKNKDIKLVFDNSSSSNLNYMMQRLGIKDVKNANIFAADGNQDVIEYIKKNTNAIGFIGANWISDIDDSKSQFFMNTIHVIGISAGKENDKFYTPTTANLKARKYPFERKIILHTKKGYGLTSAFIRFCCAQIGQLVVEKSGLLPYYIYNREIIIDRKPMGKLP